MSAVTGRPPKLTPKRAKIILDAVRKGNTRACAANLAGVHVGTLENWIHLGRAGEPGYVAFIEKLRLADGHIESTMVGVIEHCATKTKDWRAANLWLERRKNKSWGEREKSVTVNVQGGVDLTALSPEELDQLLALTTKAKKETT